MLTYEAKGAVDIFGCDVMAQVLDVDEAMLLSSVHQLPSDLILVTSQVNDGDVGRVGHLCRLKLLRRRKSLYESDNPGV